MWLRSVKSDAPIGYFSYGFGGGRKFVLGSRRGELRYNRPIFTLAS